MFDLKDIEARVKAGQSVTPKEWAYLLHNNKKAFFAFLIDNNPGSMNDVLRHQMGYSELKFSPDKMAMARIINNLIEKNDQHELHQVLTNFKLNPANTNSRYLAELQNLFKQS